MKRIGIHLLLMALGGLQAASMAWPLAGEGYGQPLAWLGLASLAGLAFFLDRCLSAREAFVTAWVFASAWLIASTWWLFIALHVYGGLPSVLAVLAVMAAWAWWVAPSHSPALAERAPLQVALVQGNVAQDMKFSKGAQKALLDYQAALLRNTGDLVVTPETAIPYFAHQLPERYWQDIRQRYASGQQAALIGMPMLGEGKNAYTNSALGLAPRQADYRYDKQHLVPFGEFVPPMFHWFLDLMNIPLGDFTRGAAVQASLNWHGERIAPNICFEDLFGEELARGFADPAQTPTMLVNLSNIAWFGDSIAIEQHLNISRMRALELHRPMLRATNTGATAVIDAQGQVVARLPSGVQDTLQAQVQGVDEPPTPYARWVSVYGLWPMVLLALGTLVTVGWQGYLARHGRRRFAP